MSNRKHWGLLILSLFTFQLSSAQGLKSVDETTTNLVELRVEANFTKHFKVNNQGINLYLGEAVFSRLYESTYSSLADATTPVAPYFRRSYTTIGLNYAFSLDNEFIPHFGMGNMFPIEKGWFRTNYTISQSGYSTKLKSCNFFYLFTLVNGVEFLITFITPAFISKDLTESVLRNFRELLIENGEMDKCLIHFEKCNSWVDLNPFHTPRYFNIYEAVIGHNSLIQKFLSMDKTFMGTITDDINLIINFSAVRYH